MKRNGRRYRQPTFASSFGDVRQNWDRFLSRRCSLNLEHSTIKHTHIHMRIKSSSPYICTCRDLHMDENVMEIGGLETRTAKGLVEHATKKPWLLEDCCPIRLPISNCSREQLQQMRLQQKRQLLRRVERSFVLLLIVVVFTGGSECSAKRAKGKGICVGRCRFLGNIVCAHTYIQAPIKQDC